MADPASIFERFSNVKPVSRYQRRADEIEDEIAARHPGWLGWDREKQLGELRRDMRWRFFSTQAMKVEKKGVTPSDFFEIAQKGPPLLASTTAGGGWSPSRYGTVGMNPELYAQRRLEEDEEKMYGRSGLFGMTPYGWS